MEAGATVLQTDCATTDGAGMPPHSWSQVTAEKFLVRKGPNYLKSKRKAKSAESFYEVRGVDWYRAGKKVDGVGSLVDLPEPEFSHPSVPSLLVVNVQLPMEAPEVFKGAKLDGPTLHAVFYFTLKEETALALEDLDKADPALRVLVGYFRRAESEPAVRTRFKAIAVVNNQEKLNMARLISPFNGKPVLITESGSLLRGSLNSDLRDVEGEVSAFPPPAPPRENGGTLGGDEGGSGGSGDSADSSGISSSYGAGEYLELDVHVRRWNYMARKGLNKVASKFGLINVSVAFLVEGRGDEELPERVLGCATLNAFDVSRAREIGV